MSQRCHHLREIEAWSCLGCGAALPEELAEHAIRCPRCAEEIRSVSTLRELATQLPVFELPEQKASEMRFALMAAARETARPDAGRSRGFSGAPPSRRPVAGFARRWVPWVALAAAVVALGIGLRRELLPSLAPTIESYAQVVLARGAQGSQVAPGPNETFVLSEGKATFSVEKLRHGQSYRVVVGRDNVAVRGTKFTVEAHQRRLEAVNVVEGVVVVTVGGDEVAALHAGEQWQREDSPGGHQLVEPGDRADPASQAAGTASRGVEVDQDEMGSAPPSEAPPPLRPMASNLRSGTLSTQRAAASGSASPSEPSASKAQAKARGDESFQKAWGLLQTGNPRAAALAFDELSADSNADTGRRSDARYWAARAYFQAGASATARERASAVISLSPGMWHAPHAALLLAEIALAQGNSSEARRWLERARASGSKKIIERADKLESRIR